MMHNMSMLRHRFSNERFTPVILVCLYIQFSQVLGLLFVTVITDVVIIFHYSHDYVQ